MPRLWYVGGGGGDSYAAAAATATAAAAAAASGDGDGAARVSCVGMVRNARTCKVQGRGEMINMRGKLVPLVRLNEQLEIGGDTIEATEGVVVVIETRSQMRGILVDELLGKSTLVIKPLVTHLKSFTGITGCSILGDGQVALILDPDSLGNLTKTQFNPKNLKLTKNHDFPQG